MASQHSLPPGFQLEYYCSCGLGHHPEDLPTEDECEIEGSCYAGPAVNLKSNEHVYLRSYWSAKEGITFQLNKFSPDENNKYDFRNFNRQELEQIKYLVDGVLYRIDNAES